MAVLETLLPQTVDCAGGCWSSCVPPLLSSLFLYFLYFLFLFYAVLKTPQHKGSQRFFAHSTSGVWEEDRLESLPPQHTNTHTHTRTHTHTLTTHKHTCLYAMKSLVLLVIFDSLKSKQLGWMYSMLHKKHLNMDLYIILYPKLTCVVYFFDKMYE